MPEFGSSPSVRSSPDPSGQPDLSARLWRVATWTSGNSGSRYTLRVCTPMNGNARTDRPKMWMDSPSDPERTQTEELGESVTFQTGDVLAGRFRINRFIAKGGMGEVYEAEDLELREQVALKIISADRLSDPKAANRFRREVQLARKITHPNVCRTFDVFKAVARNEQEVTFVTMELLRGETLADVLRRRGKLPLSEAEAIAWQAGAGLQAAHTAGVIHRDFKSRNIVLVTETASGAPRAVVTDFGIAVDALTSTETTASLSSDRMQIMGTPAYMAPEQLTGGQVTSRTDVYAFGIVLHEMACGVLPFQAETPVAAALKRLSELPEDPREYVSDLPQAWGDVIAKCLARNPSERFASIDDALSALSVGPVSQTGRWRRSFVGIVAALLIGLASAGSYVFLNQDGREGSTASPIPSRRTIALLGFRNLADDPTRNYISTVLREGIGTELRLANTLRTVPGETVERMKIELGVTSAETLSVDTLRRVRANLRTDLVILGSYLAQGEEVRFFMHVQDARSGEVIGSVTDVGSEKNLAEVVARLGAGLRGRLAGGPDNIPAESPSRAALPSLASVQRLYADGLDAMRRFDARTARGLFEKAIAQQPDFPLAHSALAAALADLGFDAQATRAAASALQFSDRLPPIERQWIEARYREASREWDRAVQLYQGLLDEDPGNLEYGLRLASVQVAAGQPAEARKTAQRLSAGPDYPDPRILVAEAVAAGAGGDFSAQQQTANRAAASARAQGAPLVAARALIDESGALLRLNELDKAQAASEEAKRLYEEGGDRHGVARALIQLGNAHRSQGRTQLAEKNLREAFSISRDLGNKRHAARALNDLANVYFDQRRFHLAAQMYDEVLKVAREVGDRYTEARALNNMGSARYALGEVTAARRLDEQALAIQRELGNPSRLAFLLGNMAETALETGDLEAAQRMYDEVLAINRELRDRAEEAYGLSGLARVLACRGRSAEAQSAAEGALRIRRELGDQEAVTESVAVAGFVAAESGDVANAVTLLKEALHTGSEADDEIRVRTASVLIGLLLDAGQRTDAETVYKKDLKAVDASELSHVVQLVAATGEGRLIVARGRRADGEAILRNAAARAYQFGFRTYELQARLELAKSELVSSPEAARRELEQLQQDSRGLGYMSLNTRALQLLEILRTKQ